VSTYVHRNGAHGITVQDESGRELALVSVDHRLHVVATEGGPSLAPQTARDLADELKSVGRLPLDRAEPPASRIVSGGLPGQEPTHTSS
jgi:hypothetical protein